MINGSIAKKLDVPLSRFAIRNMVMAKVTAEKKKFAESIENKPVFVKFDGPRGCRSTTSESIFNTGTQNWALLSNASE